MNLTRQVTLAIVISLTISISAIAHDLSRKSTPKLFSLKKTTSLEIPSEEKEVGVDWKGSVSFESSKLSSERFSFMFNGRRFIAEKNPSGVQGDYRIKNGSKIDEVYTGTFRRTDRRGRAYGRNGDYKVARVSVGKKSVYTGIFWQGKLSFSIISQEGLGSSRPVARFFNPAKFTPPSCATQDSHSDSERLRTSLNNSDIMTKGVKQSNEPATVKVMVAYTAGALGKVYKPENGVTLEEAIMRVKANALIDISFMNTHLQNSAVNAQVELACDPYALTDHGNPKLEANFAQTAAKENGDGIWDEIHALRAQCGGDLVLLYPYYGGVSSILKVPHPAGGRSAFMANFFDGAANPTFFFLDHEGGHALGLSHETANGAGLGFAFDSDGYVFTTNDGKKYRDIMNSGLDKDTAEEIPYYSNPEITYKDAPIGIVGQANAAQTLRYTTVLASQFAENLILPQQSKHSFYIQLERFPESAKMHLVADHVSYDDEAIGYSNTVRLWGADLGGISYGDYPFGMTGMRAEIFTGGEYYATLYPDRFVKSQDLVIPQFFNAQIAASINGNTLEGQVKSAANEPISALGNWLTVHYRPSSSDEFIISDFIGNDSEGRFSLPLTINGEYRVSFKTSTTTDYRITSTILSYSAGSPPSTPAPTPTIHSIPDTAPPTPTLFVFPTATPSPTVTPTPKPAVPVIFKISPPKYTNTHARIRAAVSVKKNGKFSPLENQKIQFLCAGGDGKFRKTFSTKKAGEVDIIIPIPTAQPYTCKFKYLQYLSESVIIEN